MQQKEIRALRKGDYKVPKGEENVVHYKIEKVKHDPDTGSRISNIRLVKTGVKLFGMVKRQYEQQGYLVEILYHPNNEYTNVEIPLPDDMLADEKEAEIARLKEELSKAKKAGQAEPEKKVKKETKK